MSSDEEKVLKKLAEDFINILEDSDEEKFKVIWHSKAIRFGIGNSNELMTMNKDEMIEFSLNGLMNLKKQIQDPEAIKFTIKEIVQVSCYQNIIGAVELKWQMVLPGSKGTHHTFIQFAKDEGKWQIVSVLDKGYEEQK